MTRFLTLVLLGALSAACGGGGGGGGGPGGPPGPAPVFAETTNTMLGIAGGFRDAAVLGDFMLVSVSEAESATDLNNDGDQTDAVAHLVDTTVGTSINLTLAIVGAVLVSDRHFAFLVSEANAGADLSGDGDMADSVWHILDASGPAPVVFNLMIASPSSGIAGAGTKGGFVLLQSEPASGSTDVNLDGDALDTVARVFDGNTFGLVALVLGPLAPGRPLIARNGRVLLAVDETTLGPVGSDLNGDLDQTDVILGAVDFATGAPVFRSFGRAVAAHPYALTDGAAAYLIDEASDGGADLNLDGDATDAIIAIFDFAGGTLESLPFTTAIPALTVAGTPSLGFAAGPNRVVFGVDETSNRTRDLNTDGDTADSIVAWIDTTAPGTLHLMNLPFGLKPAVIDGPRGLVAISEAAIGFAGTDLNGDGDMSDDVVHILDTSTAPGVLSSLGFAVNTMAQEGDDALLGIPEAADKGIDLNGDSVADDTVLRYVNLAAGTSRNLALVSGNFTFFRHPDGEVRIAALLSEGQSPTLNDINADGDSTDVVLELISIDPGGPNPTLLAPTPFLVGTAAAATANTAPRRAGNEVFVFATFEPMDGRDLSGDSDLLDTVLRLVTYADEDE